MSSNIITVYGIVGAGGRYLFKAFDTWKDRKMPLERKLLAGKEFEGLFKRLPRHATEPPIVFQRSYADAWSAPGELLDVAFVVKPRRLKESQFDTWAVCATVDVLGREVARLRALIDELRGRQFKEIRWFCNTLIECHESMVWLKAAYIFIHFKPVGLSVDDAQIIDSLDQIPNWLLPSKPRRS